MLAGAGWGWLMLGLWQAFAGKGKDSGTFFGRMGYRLNFSVWRASGGLGRGLFSGWLVNTTHLYSGFWWEKIYLKSS